MNGPRWVPLQGGGFVNLDRITTLKPVEVDGRWILEARGWSFCEQLAGAYDSQPIAQRDAGRIVARTWQQ